MKFTEIQQKYAEKKFIPVDETSELNFIIVKNLDDLMLIDDSFLYSEDILDEATATDLVITDMLDRAKIELFTQLGCLPQGPSWIKDIYIECHDELYNLCKVNSARFLKICSIKYNIGYSETEEPQISEERKSNIVKWILDKRKELAELKDTTEKENYAEITKYVLTKKDKFSQLPSRAAKNKYIKSLQFKLSDKFDTEDFDVCQKFTQPYLEYLLDTPFEEE